MDKLEEEKGKLRAKNFLESKLDAFQPKYGLFSFAGTLAILPHEYDKKLQKERDSEGKVKTTPKNITVSPIKLGKGPDVYFSIPGFLSEGDRYRDPGNLTISDKERAAKTKKVHDSPFKSPGPFELKSQYEHLSELVPKKRNKSTCPRGFYTCPTKKGNPNCTPGLSFSDYNYVPDPIRSKRVKNSQVSIETPGFKPTCNSPQLFDPTIYKFEGVLPVKQILKAKLKNPHDLPFKPSSPTKNNLIDALFSKFEHIPPRAISPKFSKAIEEKVQWKPSTRNFSTPTPAVATMRSNLKKEFKIL